MDTSKLDITKSYIVGEIGTSPEAKIIQELQHKVYKNIPLNIIPTHTFALLYEDNQWMVYENHLKWGGIHKYPASQYSSDAKIFQANPYPLNTDALNYHLKHNPGYSVTNLAEIAERRLLPIPIPLPDTKAWVCSQAIAASNFDICLDLGITFEVTAPCDFTYYFIKHNIPTIML